MYVDSCVVIKLFVPEPESDDIQQIINEAEDLTCSELLLAEFQSALMRKRREGQFDASTAEEFMAALRKNIEDNSIQLVKLDSSTIEFAVKLLEMMPESIPLRTLDAIHLSVCHENKIFPMFTTDKVMLKAAKHLDIPLAEN